MPMDTSGFLIIIITGIAVIAISYALDRLWAATIPGRLIYLVIRSPGVVLHECAHIAGCLLTGARIHKVVFISRDGGSVSYSRPALPYIGDVVISTAPLFLLPLALSGITWFFGTSFGCVFPSFPLTPGSPDMLVDLEKAIVATFSDNLINRFNGWFLLYMYLTVSLVLSIAPSTQDMKNAVTGSILLILAGILVVWSGIPWAGSILAELVRLLGYGFTLGLVYGILTLAVSLPLMFWFMYKHRT